MEPNLSEDHTIAQRDPYYSVTAIGICSLLFGPLAGGYMMYKNFRLLGNIKAANTTRLSFIVGTIILIAVVILAPINSVFERGVSSTVALVIYVIAQQVQKPLLDAYEKSGGQKTSFWKNTWVSFIALLVTLALIFAEVIISDIA